MAEENPKEEAKIEMEAFPTDESQQRHQQAQPKTPFFKSRSRRRRSDTWLISLFVIFNLIAFVSTMIVNDCWSNSHALCAAKPLRKLSFQPLSENPLLGPSASTLDKMGALRRTLLAQHQSWRIFSCPLLHAGLIHLIVNLFSIIFVGIYLEQEFGPLRTGIIYIVSAVFGTLVTAVFVNDSPVVSSSAALFGLLGATLSALIRNWELYTHKVVALLILFFVFACNFVLGLLPYVGNYSNIGGLIAGFLLGFALLFTPQIRQFTQNKYGLVYGAKSSFNLKQKLDRPVSRIVSLVVFVILLVGFLVALLMGINVNQHCRFCRYIDCVPFKSWSCNDVTSSCEIMESDTDLTLTCMGNGNFKVFPFTNISPARTQDLCTLICS